MNWFEKHLNWTMVLAWTGAGLLTLPAVYYVSGYTRYAIHFVVDLVVSLSVGYWVLKKKNRSMWWLLISWTIFFLLIGNKNHYREKMMELRRMEIDFREKLNKD